MIDEIWPFTELEARMQRLPLRMFSSGMLMRVLFATARIPRRHSAARRMAQRGRSEFAAKAEKRLLKLVSMAAIVIIASHDQALLRRTCTKIVHLDHGRIAAFQSMPSAALY